MREQKLREPRSLALVTRLARREGRVCTQAGCLGFPGGSQMVKNLPAMQETGVWPLSLEDTLEKGLATLSSILVWRTPWTEELGGLQSIVSQRVGHNWETNQRRQWHPTPVLLPGKSHGWRSLVGCSPWGRKESCWATSLSLFTFMHWRRKWQPNPVFLPGESQGRGSLVYCCLWVAQSRTWLKRLSNSNSRETNTQAASQNLFAQLSPWPQSSAVTGVWFQGSEPGG